jgi:hypothetical protein
VGSTTFGVQESNTTRPARDATSSAMFEETRPREKKRGWPRYNISRSRGMVPETNGHLQLSNSTGIDSRWNGSPTLRELECTRDFQGYISRIDPTCLSGTRWQFEGGLRRGMVVALAGPTWCNQLMFRFVLAHWRLLSSPLRLLGLLAWLE